MKLDLESRLKSVLREENIRFNEPMKQHTTFKIGGPADYFVTPQSVEEIRAVINCIRDEDIPYCIIGNGSNLLVSDEGYRGVVIQLFDKFSDMEIEPDTGVVKVMAGSLLSRMSMQAAAAGLSGLEFAAGIPGTVGGAVVMNAGAYGGEIKDCIANATFLNREGEVITLAGEKMELSYRSSIAMKKDYVVLAAEFKLKKADKESVMAKIRELAEARKEKQPLEFPSAGSTFKRPDGYFAAKLIEEAGLKGFTVGGAKVSDKHAGFVINAGNATARDVAMLVDEVKKRVFENSGVKLEMEVRKLGNFN